VAFDAAYNHYQKGPLVIGAPYCGPPPKENVYVFQFETDMSNIGEEEGAIRLEQYTRSQAAMMTGLGEVAALPTGMILFDMRIFDLYRPSPRHKRIVLRDLAEGKITVRQAEIELQDGWFHYEWTDGYCDQKASTEDVCSTRDMGMCCSAVLGYNPLRCAWDSWIGHHKPWNCGRPNFYKVENVAAAFKQVCASDASIDEKIVSNFRSASIADFPVYQPPENGNGHAKTSKRADRGRAAKPGG
jgi:hypothetical protein